MNLFQCETKNALRKCRLIPCDLRDLLCFQTENMSDTILWRPLGAFHTKRRILKSESNGLSVEVSVLRGFFSRKTPINSDLSDGVDFKPHLEINQY